MRDLPVFSTENGVASLVLREVPYKAEAYITLRDSQAPELLLAECVDFCKAAGAEHVFAKGHSVLEKYPLHTAVWQMQRVREGMPETDAALFPVTEETLEQWCSIYNEKMKPVPNAATMTRANGKKHIAKGTGYFVHQNGELLGIGIVEGDSVETVVSVKPRCGYDVMLALCGAIYSEEIRLEVASTNIPAIKLYEKLGFVKTKELSRWYCVYKIGDDKKKYLTSEQLSCMIAQV